MLLEFTKMHGAGNDYVYVDCTKRGELSDPGRVSELVSPRHHAVGADGLIMICRSEVADFKMRIFNADGSEGKMCGNGIRCVAKYVFDHGLTDKTTIRVETLSGVKTIDVQVKEGKVMSAKVDMGEPVFRTKEIPMISDHYVFVDQGLAMDKVQLEVYNGTAISMGNPHFVIFVKDVDNYPVTELGPRIEHHPLFPEGVNVEFVEVVDKNTVKFRVWERGSGETMACGTGACAVTVAANLLNNAGKQGEPLTVICKGGTLSVTYGKDGHVYMEGPAVEAFSGKVEVED